METAIPPLSVGDSYRTAHPGPRGLSRVPGLRTLLFYGGIMGLVLRGTPKAKRGLYDGRAWVESSMRTIYVCERAGMEITVEGLDHIRALTGPAVFVANHMSTLETFALVCMIQPLRPMAYVVKESLTTYPIFRHVMCARDPVVVGRTNAREDLVKVLQGGAERIARGISMVIFPQATRSAVFDPAAFNTLGVKLAARTGVPVVPVALLTDAWANGSLFRDLGAIHPRRPVHFAFGEPMPIQGRGAEEHRRIVEFITNRLESWGGTVRRPPELAIEAGKRYI